MKSIIFAIVAVFASFSAVASDTVYRVKSGSSTMFTDLPLAGAVVVKAASGKLAAPAVVHIPVSGQGAPVPVRNITQDQTVLNAIAAEKQSAIADRERTYRGECLAMSQEIENLQSSRTVNIDPYTGGRLEERQIRELTARRSAMCS